VTAADLLGSSYTDVLGYSVFSSHRPHCSAKPLPNQPTVKLFITYAHVDVPFDPDNDTARHEYNPAG
jgi:hypothetical protein